MSIYSRIFAKTSQRFASAAISGRSVPPHFVWGAPGFVAFTWFIWGALNDDIKESVGLYWDPDAAINRVEAEYLKRMEAREALKAASSPSKDDDEEEEEDEGVTAEDIEEAVNAAIEQSGGDDDEDEPAPEEEEEEEEEEAPKPKKKKVDASTLTKEEKWDMFTEKAISPGEDDVSIKHSFASLAFPLAFSHRIGFDI